MSGPTFKCARCNYLRQSATDACDKCGWAPKKASYDAAARDAGEGIINEVLASAAARRREKQLAGVVVGALLLAFIGHWVSLEPLGERCEENEDCRSKLCLQMYPGPNVCSERCDDSECDEGYLCVGATERTTSRRTFMAHESSAKVCVPVTAVPPPEPDPESDVQVSPE
jgi:hypothetical protein